MTTTYRIHPAIGIARLGNSVEYYIGPEEPGGLPTTTDGKPVTAEDLRDKKHKMKRQAARFCVFRYDDQNPSGKPIKVGSDGVKAVVWTVHLANKKASWYAFLTNAGEYGYGPDHPLRNPTSRSVSARRKLMIDPGPRTVDSRDPRPQRFDHVPKGYRGGFPHSWYKPPPSGPDATKIKALGEDVPACDGELYVLGGFGISGRISTGNPAITQYANNDGWFDDTSDGPVTATVVLEDDQTCEVEGAWVIAGPPGYAPQIGNIVTLYDTIFDGAVRQQAYRPEIFADELWNSDYRPDFNAEIRPFLERPEKYKWVTAIPPHPHRFDLERLGDPDPAYNGYRQYYLDHIRPPSQGDTYASAQGAPLMPYLAGDNALKPGYLPSDFLTVTNTQYFILQQWAAGNFIGAKETSPRPPRTPGEEIDKGVLDNCVGGAFSPGIEMTWISRVAAIYESPFRIKRRPVDPRGGLSPGLDTTKGLEPGDVTRYMAVPWQADFNECSVQSITVPQTTSLTRWLWWWPPQRPEIVWRSSDPATSGPLKQEAWIGQKQIATAGDYISFAEDIDMVEHWSELGFILEDEDGTGYHEVARTLKP